METEEINRIDIAAERADETAQAPEPVTADDDGEVCGETAETVDRSDDEPAIDIDRLVAEAEQRGYLRGCNERIEELMTRPGLWQGETPDEAGSDDDGSDILILNNPRTSIWDD